MIKRVIANMFNLPLVYVYFDFRWELRFVRGRNTPEPYVMCYGIRLLSGRKWKPANREAELLLVEKE